MIDGWMPIGVRARLVAAVRTVLATIDAEGLSLPPVREGADAAITRAQWATPACRHADRFLVGATAISV